MTTTTQPMEQHSNDEAKPTGQRSGKRTNNILAGIIIVTVGSFLLAKQMGTQFPDWLFTWQMLVIVVGIYSGVKNNFRDSGWIIVISVGVVLLLKDYMEGFSLYHTWPAVIILIGLCMIFYPRKKKNCF